MTNRARELGWVLAAVVLAGCGGGGHASALPFTAAANAAAAPAGPNAADTVTFAITAPPQGAPARTRSIAITVDPGPGAQTASRDVAVGTSISVALPAVPGDHTFTFATYDGAAGSGGKPQGSELSQNAGIPFTVARGAATTIGVSLGGVPMGTAVLPAAGQDVRGTQSTGFDLYGFYKADGATAYDRTFTALATDAAGNLILGPGAPAVAVTSSDPSTFSNGLASPANPNLFTVAAMRYDASAQTQLVVTTSSPNARAAPLRATVPLRIAARNAPRIYVMDHRTSGVGKVWVFDEQGDRIAVPGAFAGLNGGLGIAYDARLDRLYVTNEFSSAITVYDPDGNTVATSGSFEDLYFPLGISVDGARSRIYAGNFNGGGGTGRCGAGECGLTAYDEHGARVAVSGGWRAREGTSGYLPYGVFADPDSGRVYVADAGYGRVEAYDASGSALLSWPAGDGATGIAQDALTKNLYVTDDDRGVNVYDRDGNALFTCARGACGGGPAGASAWKNLHGPMGIRQSPGNGWFYVANYANNSVTAYDRDGAQMTLRGANLGGGPFGFNGAAGALQGPIAIEVVP
jgi:DNA-binding beta-propeller fold protein YncE